MVKEIYEVYVCCLNNEVLYVGHGLSGRHNHCNSGSSHVYELNRLHFLGSVFNVKVVKLFSKKADASAYEVKLISDLKPKLNSTYNKKREVGKSKLKLLDKILKESNPKVYYRYASEIFFGVQDFKSLVLSLGDNFIFKYELPKYYDKLDLTGLRRLSYNFHNSKEYSYGAYFADCVNEVYCKTDSPVIQITEI